MRRIIFVLSIIISGLFGSSAQALPIPTFLQFCQTYHTGQFLSSDNTVRALLDVAQTTNCQQALGVLQGLAHLDLSNRGIVDLRPVADFTQLQKLILDGNPLGEKSAVGHWSGLPEDLWEMPIAPLSQLTSLKELSLKNTQVQTLSALSALPLTSLWIDADAVIDLSPLSSIAGLQTLSASSNDIQTAYPLRGLSKLQSLNLSDNPIRSLDPLTGLTALTQLRIANARILDASALSANKALTTLDLSENFIRDPSPLAKLSQLKTLSLGDNPVGSDQVQSLRQALPNAQIVVGDGTPSDFMTLCNAASDTSWYKPGDIGGNLALQNTVQALRVATHSEQGPVNCAFLKVKLSSLQELDVNPLFRGWFEVRMLSEFKNLKQISLTNVDLSQISHDYQIPGASGQHYNPLSALSQLPNLEVLKLENTNSSDLTPLVWLPQLTVLDLNGNQGVDDLDPLSELPALTEVDLSNTSFNDLSPLLRISHLQVLDLSGTSIDDLTPLTQLHDLQELHLAGASMDELSFLSSLPALQKLSIPNSGLTNLAFLSNTTHLTDLDVSQNMLTSLDGIENDRLLQTLNAGFNQLDDSVHPSVLTPLRHLLQLRTVDLSQNRISDLCAFVNHPYIKTLRLPENQVKDLHPLSQASSSMVLLDISSNPIQADSLAVLSTFHGLMELDAEDCGITDLSFLAQGSNAISVLDLSGNAFKSIQPLTHLSILSTLRINDVKGVSDWSLLSSMTQIGSLSVDRTGMSDLSPIAGMTRLVYVSVAGNGIQTLDPLKGVQGLLYLDISDNQISTLDPIEEPTLNSLYASNNEFVDLDFVFKFPLYDLDLSGNPYTRESIAKLAALHVFRLKLSLNSNVQDQDMENLQRALPSYTVFTW